MKILKLEIKNLASLDREGGEVINFEAGALKDSTIFSIVGPTGSGKSTILDAICLALYGRAPRYPKVKGSKKQKIEIYGEMEEGEKNRIPPTDCRNILSRGKKEGYSKLTFLTNKGDVYRAEWYVEFKQKKYSEDKHQLYKITTNGSTYEEQTAEWDTIPEIIGLDYDQFLLTVLIAQGSFADFLKADVEERYKLLEKLIGSEQLYTDIFSEIKNKASDAATAYTHINADFSAYEKDIIQSDEELEQLKARIAELDKEQQKSKKELGRISEDLMWFSTEGTFVTNIGKYLKAKTQAEEAIKSASAEFDRLALHDSTLPATTCYKEIKEYADNFDRLKKTLEQIAEAIEKKQSDIKDGNKALEKLKEKEAAANKEFDDKKPHIDRARTIKGELTSEIENLNEKEKTKAQCETEYNKTRTAYAGSINLTGATPNEELDSAIAAFNTESKKIEGIDVVQLQTAQSTAEQQKNDIREAIRIQKEIGTKREKLRENADLRQEKDKRNQEIADELEKLQIDALTAELQTLRTTHTLMTSEDWALHRTHLEEGTPCPLCGATTHPYKNEAILAPVINDLQKLIKEKKKNLDEQREKQRQLGKEQGEINGILSGLDKSDQTLNNDLTNLKNSWDPIHQRHPDWTEDVAALEALQPIIVAEADSATTALENYNTAAANVNKLRTIKDAGVALLNATTAYNDATAKVNGKKEEMKNEIGDKDPDTLERELNEAKSRATEDVNAKNESIGKLREELQGLNGRKENMQNTLGEEKRKHEERTGFLKEWLATYNSSHELKLTEADIADLYLSNDQWDEIRKRQGKLSTELTQASTTYNNEVTKHTEHQEKKPAQTQEELMARKTELENKSFQELVDAKTRLEKHEEATAKTGELGQQLKDALQLKTDWENIFDAMGGDGKQLRKIAQCYTLRFLVEHANAEIRKFNSRYELQQVKNSLGLRVIDHDRADDVRDTTSLSGGETFIVSLGLALGLSSLSSRNISFENLFIDEGFGTLDPDTLATVIDSLAMLQSSQGKKVGVISHTDTMSERITTQIRLIPQGNSGSSHIEIYPETPIDSLN